MGYATPSAKCGDVISINELAVIEGQSLRAVMPTVLRWTKILGEAEAVKQNKTVKGVYLSFGREHPAYDAIPDMLPSTRIPYGWYIRVADVPGLFITSHLRWKNDWRVRQ